MVIKEKMYINEKVNLFFKLRFRRNRLNSTKLNLSIVLTCKICGLRVNGVSKIERKKQTLNSFIVTLTIY